MRMHVSEHSKGAHFLCKLSSLAKQLSVTAHDLIGMGSM